MYVSVVDRHMWFCSPSERELLAIRRFRVRLRYGDVAGVVALALTVVGLVGLAMLLGVERSPLEGSIVTVACVAAGGLLARYWYRYARTIMSMRRAGRVVDLEHDAAGIGLRRFLFEGDGIVYGSSYQMAVLERLTPGPLDEFLTDTVAAEALTLCAQAECLEVRVALRELLVKRAPQGLLAEAGKLKCG